MSDDEKLTERAIDAIKRNIYSITFNKSTNSYEIILNNCKLMENQYDKKSVKISINPSSSTTTTTTTKNGLSALKEDNVDDDKKTNMKEEKKKLIKKKKKRHSRQRSKTTDDLSLFDSFSPSSPRINEEEDDENEETDTDKKENDDNKDNDNNKPTNSKKKEKKKKKIPKKKQPKKITKTVKDDSYRWHEKFTFYNTKKELLTCVGSADAKCRYKNAGSIKFGAKNKREDFVQFRVPLKGQVIYAFIVEDNLGDGSNGDIQKVEGGEFKKYVRVFVRSQWGKGVNVTLHVWYKFK